MADEHGVVASRVQPAVHGIVQRGLRQRTPALQHQMLVQHEVAFIRGLKSRRPGRCWAGPGNGFGHNTHCAV